MPRRNHAPAVARRLVLNSRIDRRPIPRRLPSSKIIDFVLAKRRHELRTAIRKRARPEDVFDLVPPIRDRGAKVVCRKRLAFKKEMMKKIAAQVSASGGKLRKWRAGLSHDKVSKTCLRQA